MAVLLSPPFREDSIPQRLISLAEGLFEVLSHALFLRPAALQQMLPPDAALQTQFFDVWLTVAQIRSGWEAIPSAPQQGFGNTHLVNSSSQWSSPRPAEPPTEELLCCIYQAALMQRSALASMGLPTG